MAKSFEFWFDVGSPAAYLAWKRLPAFSTRHGASVQHKPMLLGGVFKATGNASPVTIPAKGKWLLGDLARAAKRDGVPLGYPPEFPVNTLALMRAAIGLQRKSPERFVAFVDVAFDSIFSIPRKNIQDGGFEPDAILALTNDPEVKQALIRNTEEAVARGVFGAPTFFVGDEMFWGQDRMNELAEALTLSRREFQRP
jgi:2-hydroxychromene-2-carboxylate isomerase